MRSTMWPGAIWDWPRPSAKAAAPTIPLIRSGLIDYVIAQDPLELLTTVMGLAARRTDERTKELHLLDFGLYTKFNLPSYGTMATHP